MKFAIALLLALAAPLVFAGTASADPVVKVHAQVCTSSGEEVSCIGAGIEDCEAPKVYVIDDVTRYVVCMVTGLLVQLPP
jgi:hypothetical protein